MTHAITLSGGGAYGAFEVGVLKADTPQKLVAYIQWASVSASISVSQGRSRAGGPPGEGHNVELGHPPTGPMMTSSTDEF